MHFFPSLLYLVNIRLTVIANIYKCKLQKRFIRLDLVVSGKLCKQDKHWLIKVCYSSSFDNCDILRAWDWFVQIHNNHHYIIWPTSPRSHLHKLAPIHLIYVAPYPLHLPTCSSWPNVLAPTKSCSLQFKVIKSNPQWLLFEENVQHYKYCFSKNNASCTMFLSFAHFWEMRPLCSPLTMGLYYKTFYGSNCCRVVIS